MANKLKVIHTSDWHLGQRLYNYDRTDEEICFLNALADIISQEQPDVLLISGDIYHTCTPGNEIARLFTDRLLDIQSRCPDMEVIVIAGNHDSYSRLEIDQALWARCHVRILGVPAEKSDGTADYAQNIIVLKDKGIIAAVPFCHPRNFPCTDAQAETVQRDAAYFHGLREAVSAMNTNGLPTILMAHLAVGKEISFTGQERRDVIGGEECVDPDVLGTGYDYVALGHIHCPQWVKWNGRKVARYCGTPRPIHFDEQHCYAVDVLDIEAGQEPVLHSVPITPLKALRTVGGTDGLPFADTLKILSGQTAVSNGDYLRLNVLLTKGEQPGIDWNERARMAAEACGMRFCLLNYIRQQEDRPEHQEQKWTIQQILDFKDDDVLQILNEAYPLSDKQTELLKGLMAEMHETSRD